MSNTKHNDLDFQCISTIKVPKHCIPYNASAQQDASTVTCHTLLISLGILRWIVKRELNQIYILDQSLQVPRYISSLLPAKSPKERKSSRAIMADGEKLAIYLKQLAHHKSAADAKFVVFATSWMQIFQFFVVKGCSREDINGIYVYKEHQGTYTKYENYDNPKFVLINKFWSSHSGWYLAEKWRYCFYAKSLAKDSVFPPAGVWQAVDKGQSSEYIEVVSSLPTKSEIWNAMRRKLYLLHKSNISRVQCRLLSAADRALSPRSPWRSPSSPSLIEAENSDDIRRYISSPVQQTVKTKDDSKTASNEYVNLTPYTRLFQSNNLSPKADEEICSILNRERVRKSKRVSLEERKPAIPKQGRKVNTPIWLSSSMPANAGRGHRISTCVDPEAITPTERDRKHGNKAPFKFSPLKIKIPSRPDLPPPIAGMDSEDSMDSDPESSLEMLTPRESRSSESGSLEMLTPKRVSRPFSNNSQLEECKSSEEVRKTSDESESVSVRWFSYAVHETDDSIFSQSSKTETWSTKELKHGSSESFKSPYERRSGEIENDCGREMTLTADSHIWNPSARRRGSSSGTANSSSGSFVTDSTSKTPIVREKTSPTTSNPDHVVSLKDTWIRREEKEELSQTYSRSSTHAYPHAMNSPSLIRLPMGVGSPQGKDRDRDLETYARLSMKVRSPLSIRTPPSVEDMFEERRRGSSSIINYYQQQMNSKCATTDMARAIRLNKRGSKVPRTTLI